MKNLETFNFLFRWKWKTFEKIKVVSSAKVLSIYGFETTNKVDDLLTKQQLFRGTANISPTTGPQRISHHLLSLAE